MTRAMKDNGVAWFGFIPLGWKLVQIKRLFNIGRGRVIATTELCDTGYPVYSSQTKNDGILGYIETYDYDKSQLTWTTDGANAGTVFLRKGKHNCTNVCGTLTLKSDNENNLDFLKYIVAFTAVYHKRSDINGYKIMNNEMADITILLPELPEQSRIAAFLDEKCAAIDALIEQTRASIEEYKKLKQAVITQAVTKGIRPNRKMKDSGIEWVGEMPEEWDVVNLRRNFTFGKGLPITRENLREVGVQVINYGQIHSKSNSGITITQELIRFVDGDYLLSNPDSLVRKDDFIFADTSEDLAGCGNCVYVDKEEQLFAGYHTIILHNRTSYVQKYYAFLFLSDAWRSQIRKRVTGVKVFSISQKILRETSILVPPFAEQSSIAAYLDEKCAAIDALMDKKEHLASELENYKKSLIFEYVTGKKEVPA